MVTVQPAPNSILQFQINGVPISGGKLFTYQNLTQTKQNTYTDYTAGTPNANPILLDFNGTCTCWLDISKVYTFVLSPSTDTDPPTNPYYTENGITAVAGGIPVPVAIGGTGRTDGVGLILNCGLASAVGNVYSATSNPAPAALTVGQTYLMSVGATNTGASQFNVNGFGNAAITMDQNNALSGGELQPGTPYLLTWDGVEFNAQPVGSGIYGQFGGLTMLCGSVSGTNTITMTVVGALLTRYTKGQRFIFQATAQNTGATTININGVGAVTCQYGGFACTGGEIGYNSTLSYGQWIEALYDGTDFQLSKAFALNNGVGTALTAYYKNSWTDFGGSDQPGFFYKDALGFVHLTGVIAGGTPPSIAAKLPSGQGLYPNKLIGFPSLSNNLFGGFTVDTSGNIAVTVGSGTSFGLDGATWYGNPAS